MFRHILVPLDGTQCAEQALPVAVKIARTTDAIITLMRVIHLPGGNFSSSLAPELISEDMRDARQESAEAYLHTILRNPLLRDITVQTEITIGTSLADTLIQNAQNQQIDLIVLCRHGNTGMKRFLLGSVTRQVARLSTVPVLILQQDKQTELPTDGQPSTHQFHILVTLDGSPESETAIQPAAVLSSVLSAPASGKLHLLHVVVPVLKEQKKTKQTIEQVNAQRSETAEHYLKTVKERLLKGAFAASLPLDVDTSIRLQDDIAETLITVVYVNNKRGDNPFDAIALATHGRHGIPRWLLGSVTEHIMNHTHLPMLIVRHAPSNQSEISHMEKG